MIWNVNAMNYDVLDTFIELETKRLAITDQSESNRDLMTKHRVNRAELVTKIKSLKSELMSHDVQSLSDLFLVLRGLDREIVRLQACIDTLQQKLAPMSTDYIAAYNALDAEIDAL